MRLILAGAMAASVGSAAFLAQAPQMAYADTGSVTINSTLNSNAAYISYKLFTADVDTNDKASHVAWNNTYKTAVLAFLDSADNGASITYANWLSSKGFDASTHDNASNAAQYISEMIAASATSSDSATTPDTKMADSFAAKLARAMNSGPNDGLVNTGDIYTNDEGYYLFVNNSVGAYDATQTAPIWFALGGSSDSITAKEASVSSAFQVKEDSTATWGKIADANSGQDLDFKSIFTVPQNIDAFESFYVKDQIGTYSSLALANNNDSSITVKVGGVDVTNQLNHNGSTASTKGNITVNQPNDFFVEITDIKALDGVTIDKDTTIEIEYKAHLTGINSGNVFPLDKIGSQAYSTYTFSSDPNFLSRTSTASTKSVSVYTYRFDATKLDKANQTALAGAKFTIQAVTDQGALGDYVQADGSLGSTPYEFTSADGTAGTALGYFLVPSLDQGTYTIHETQAPAGYQVQDADVVLTVTSTLDQTTGRLTDFQASFTGGEVASVDGDVSTGFYNVADFGVINMRFVDDREFELARTGLEGNVWLYAIAAALAAAGVAGYVTYRRRETEQD